MVVPRAAVGVTAYELDDEVVLYDAGGGQAFVLNRSGATIWGLCDGNRDLSAIARELAAAYDLPLEQALNDVRELVDDLKRAGLVNTD